MLIRAICKLVSPYCMFHLLLRTFLECSLVSHKLVAQEIHRHCSEKSDELLDLQQYNTQLFAAKDI